jgi:hypothetical protein
MQNTVTVEFSTGLVKCTSCGFEKIREDFHKNPSKKSGRDSHCKTCVGIRKRAAKEKKSAELIKRRRRRLDTKIQDIEDFVVTETFVENGWVDEDRIVKLLQSFLLGSGG